MVSFEYALGEGFVGQFGSTLSKKGRLCKKGLKYQVACQKKNLRRATSSTRAIGSPTLALDLDI